MADIQVSSARRWSFTALIAEAFGVLEADHAVRAAPVLASAIESEPDPRIEHAMREALAKLHRQIDKTP